MNFPELQVVYDGDSGAGLNLAQSNHFYFFNGIVLLKLKLIITFT